jgi:hypothetical protein
MMFLEEVARYLAAQGIGTWPGNIFLNGLPDKPDAAITLFDTGGAPPVDSYQGGMNRPKIQVVARSTSMAAAWGTAQAAYDALHMLSSVTLAGGTRLIDATALQTPFWLKRDALGRQEYAFNVQFRVEATRPTLAPVEEEE